MWWPAPTVNATALAVLEPPPFVPREFLGMAREFRNVLVAEDPGAGDKQNAIAAALRSRLAKGSLPRPEAIKAAAQAWREVPATGRLRLEVELSTRRLVIRELRVGAADNRFPGWRDWEDSFVILLTGFSLVRWNFAYHYEMLASISLHGLGRRYQRGADSSPAAVMADFAALATATPESTAPGRFEVRTSNGRWAGRVVPVHGSAPVLAARTFL